MADTWSFQVGLGADRYSNLLDPWEYESRASKTFQLSCEWTKGVKV